MRLHLISCLTLMQAIGLAFPSSNFLSNNAIHSGLNGAPLALTVAVDSIHNIDCVYTTGYLKVKATGGVSPYTYLWNNGNTTAVSATLEAGGYQVTVTDNAGATAVVNAEILIDQDYPDADAGIDFTVACTNTAVTLSGGGTQGPTIQYSWLAMDGGLIQSGANTLQPTIKHTGVFTLTVTNTTNNCSKMASVTVFGDNEPPTATASGGTFSCNLPVVTLNGTFPSAHTSFVWNGPNGYTSTLLNPQVAIVGTYILKVTDTLTTCFTTANAVVVADTVKPVAVPVGGILTCAQPALTITGSYSPVGVTFSWIGPNGFTSSLQTPVATVPGDYRVTVTNPTNGCTTVKLITLGSNFSTPTASASVNGSLTCAVTSVQLNGNGSPAGITYTWSGPNSFSSTAQNPMATQPGVYTLITRHPVSGCTTSSSVTVLLNNTPPGVTATGGTKTCANPTVTLQASSPTQSVTFKWSGPSGFTSTLPSPMATLVGNYTVTVTNPANGCTSSTTVAITQNIAAPNLNAVSTTVTCNTPNPRITATSTTQGATFSWAGPNGFSSTISNPVVTAGGTYTVTATNPVNGCTAVRTIFVEENLSAPFVNAGEDRALNCLFTTILANPIGTATGSNITYLWTTWDGHIFSGETILYARFDAVGHYTLTVKNTTNGCTSKDSMEVTQTPPFALSATPLTAVSCNGGNNGSARAMADGGATPYTYIWNNGGQTATINNLSAGTYTVTVTDFEGCSATANTTISQPTVLQANVTSTNQTVVGMNNGSATVSASGGTGPYTQVWSTGSTAPTIINLAPGAYTVTVTDNKGCTISKTANVNPVNCSISGEISAVNLTCAGIPSGSATATVTGVPSPITYTWSNGASTKTASNLAAGNYQVTVTGANGCSTVLTTQISAPQPLVLSVVANTAVSCFGAFNGSASMNTTGGTTPYSYAWSNSNTGASISNVGAGTYTCTTTDAVGCTAVQTVQVTSPQALTLAVATKTDVACIDGQTGAITMTSSGGTGPFNYTWSNSATGATISNLPIGNYQCTVTDAQGCSKNQSAQIVATDNTPPQLVLKNASAALGVNGTASITAAMFDDGSFDQTCTIVNWTISPTSVSCSQLGPNTVTLTATDKNGNTATGTAIVTVIDNIAPSLTCPPNMEAAACASTVQFNDPQIQDNCTSTGAPVLVSGLPSGASFPVGITNQQFSYTDAGGNTSSCQFTVTVTAGAAISTSSQPTSCSGNCDGSATLTVLNGSNPSSVSWSNGQSGLSAIGLCPGTYFATVTDAAGCSQTFAVQVQTQDSQAPTLFCPNNIVTGYCSPMVTYQQPQVLDNCAVNMQQLQLLSGLPSGSTFPAGATTQVFRYTDGGGNQAECNFSVTVHLPPSVNTSVVNGTCAGVCNGSASISVTGGQGPFGILWTNGAVGPVAANLCPGMYMATVSDADGCIQTQVAQISQPLQLLLFNSNVSNDLGNTGSGSISVTMTGGTLPYTYAWTLNGQPFSTAQNLLNLFAGEYALMVTDANGCVYFSNPFVVSTSVATTAPANQLQWSISPNPATAAVTLNIAGLEGEDTRIELFDAAGRLLLESAGTTPEVQLSLTGVPDGMLLVRILCEKGMHTKVLVKGGL